MASAVRLNLTHEEASAVYSELLNAIDGQEHIDPRVERTLDKLERVLGTEALRIASLTSSGRPCTGGCGLATADGDVFCPGCREGHEAARTYDDPDRLGGP